MSIFDDLIQKPDDPRVQVQRAEDDIFSDLIQGDPSFFDEYGRDPRQWLIDAAKNAPESAMNLLVQLGTIISKPKQTARGVVDLTQAAANKLGRTAAEVVQGRELERMPERSEVAADVVGEEIAGRYGGVENILRTAVEDPMGFGLDVGSVGAGLGSKTLRTADPMTATSRLADIGATKAAKAQYGEAVGIPKSMKPERREALIDTGMETAEGTLFSGKSASQRGLQNLEAAKADAASVMNDIIDNMGAGDTFDVSVINSKLDDLMRGYEGKAGGTQKIAEVNRLKHDIYNQFVYRHPDGSPVTDQAGNTVLRERITARELHDFKSDIYPRVYKRERDPDAIRREGAETKGMKQQARAATQELHRTYPELIDPSIEWGKNAQLKPMIERSMERFAEYDAGLIPYISKKVRDPSWRSKLAIATRKLADGDIAWLEKNLPSADIRIALVMAGRNQEILEQETERRIPEIEIRQGIAQ